MSLSGMINTALSGIFTSQSAMRTISSNIANVNTEGYQRQVVHQENLVVGGNSVGVRITNIERIVDRFLNAAGLTASSATAEGTVQREFHDRFQSIIGRPDSGTTLSARLDKVFNSFANLTLSPADGIVRQATLESVTDLSIEISRLAQNIQDLRSEASQKINEEVLNVNEALERIHKLNPLIIRQKAKGGETSGLEKQRDMAVADLAKSIDVKTITDDDGRMTVLTSGGVTLVDLSRRELEYVAPGVVTAATNFASIRDEFALNSITCTSLSKTFNLAGLQLSNIIIPNIKLRNKFRNTIESLFLPEELGYLPNSLSLAAFTAGYEKCDDWLSSIIQYIQQNLLFLKSFLETNIPQIKVNEPEGTYLVWLDFKLLGIAYDQLEEFLHKKAKVALDDGAMFGKGGEGFQRINIACPRSTLSEALTRIHKAVKELKSN